MRQSSSLIGCVRLSVSNAFVRRFTRRTLMAYLALFIRFGTSFESSYCQQSKFSDTHEPSLNGFRLPWKRLGKSILSFLSEYRLSQALELITSSSSGIFDAVPPIYKNPQAKVGEFDDFSRLVPKKTIRQTDRKTDKRTV